MYQCSYDILQKDNSDDFEYQDTDQLMDHHETTYNFDINLEHLSFGNSNDSINNSNQDAGSASSINSLRYFPYRYDEQTELLDTQTDHLVGLLAVTNPPFLTIPAKPLPLLDPMAQDSYSLWRKNKSHPSQHR